ncbi:MAG TPA: imidazole glycerol phosphate synthase subunit HisH [Ancylobacter sp.]
MSGPAMSGTVALIDYGSGNLHSAGKALERAAREGGTGLQVIVTSDPDAVRRAERILLPGVGAYADCRRGLDAVPGMVDALTEAVIEKGRPFLGICVGLQLMATRGLEHGITKGLGWIAGDVVKITPDDAGLKIPHMGWNSLDMRRPHALLEGIPTGADGLDAYFVHSYHLEPARPEDVVATSEYGGSITAMVARDNIAGTQFHPEKSQRLGLALLANFLKWAP